MMFSKALIVVFLLFSAFIHASERPNILLVLSDDHSLPHLGCYGDENIKKYNLTPNLDAFSNEGIRFERAYTSAPQCAPSRTSIFAGRSPVGLSVTRFSQPARREIPFFTDILKDNGYWVGLEGRHHHLDGRVKDDPHMIDALVSEKMKDLESRFDLVSMFKTKDKYLNEIPKTLHRVFDSIPKEKPFFLYFGFNQPHRTFGLTHEGIDPKALKLPKDWPDLPEVRKDYAKFLDDVRDLDIGFGHIEKVLKERGLKDNTLVIFMGDNGEALLRGKGTLYQRGLNVPLMVRWPNKIKGGRVSHTLINGLDLAATILETVNLKPAKGMTSVSFYPELLGEDFNGRSHLFAERGWHFGPITRSDGFDLSRAVITKDYHFIYNVLPNQEFVPVDMVKKDVWKKILLAHEKGQLSKLHRDLYFSSSRPIFQLFNVADDPLQLNNLSGQGKYKDLETEMRQLLDAWMIKESDYLPLPSHAHQLHFGKKR